MILKKLINNEEKIKNALINAWISYPIVFTDLPDMGTIMQNILNNTPFFNNILYHLDIYTTDDYNNVENSDGSNYLRFSTGNNLLNHYHGTKMILLPSFVSTWYIYDLFQVKCKPKFTIIYEIIM